MHSYTKNTFNLFKRKLAMNMFRRLKSELFFFFFTDSVTALLLTANRIPGTGLIYEGSLNIIKKVPFYKKSQEQPHRQLTDFSCLPTASS